MSRYNFRITERIVFFLERQFVKGAHYQLLFVAALIGVISIVGGILVWPVDEPRQDLPEAIWWAFLRLSDPGYLGDDQGIWRRFISTIITVLGYVVFLGSLVAIITTWMNRKIRNLEQGLTPVAAQNHVLILGWTNKTIHIAAELFLSVNRLRGFLKRHGVRTLKLIILADDVTPDRLQELKDHRAIGDRAQEIILRSGESIDREHLRRVDCLNASAIIIPNQSYGNRILITPDVETIKTLLTLDAELENGNGAKKPYVVAEIQDENKLKAANRAYSGPLEVIASDTILSRLIAQNIRHTGLSEVYNELLAQNLRNSIFVRDFPEIEGKTASELKRAFPKAIVLGVVSAKNGTFQPELNIANERIFKKDESLVLMARKLGDTELDPKREVKPGLESIDAIDGYLPVEEQKETTRILIMGWNHHIPALIHELGTYEDETYEITIASLRPIEERKKELTSERGESPRVRCKQVVADYVRETELKDLEPAGYDNILLASSDKMEDEEEADARTIVGYILLEGVLESAEKKPQILIELADPSNENLLKRFESEVIIGPMILSHLLAQIALRRELNSIYNELFTVGGAEIIFRRPEEYKIETETISFRELEKRAMKYNETALGIFREPASGEIKKILKMNPGREENMQIKPDTLLVVLTTIY